MLINIVLFLTLIAYSVIVSQSFMYILSLRDTQLRMEARGYIQFRHLIDANMQAKFRYAVYGALLASLILMALAVADGSGFFIGCAAIAFVALVLDTVITVKGNLPINKIMNGWTINEYPANWSDMRGRWLHYFQLRQILNITGFIALVAGTVFR